MAGQDSERDVVRQERRGGALWLRLNRPQVLNAISPQVLEELERGLDRAEADAEIFCVVIAAEGRVFCAGADLKYVDSLVNGDDAREGVRDEQQGFLRIVASTFNRIEAFPKPVIAAVHALAVAGGLELVLCCDLVIAADSARFGDAHGNYGLVAGGGGTIRLARRLGPARAKHLLFTGENFPAADFLGTDLVNAVVPDDELDSNVARLVDSIAAKSPLALRLNKELVNDGLEAPLDIALRMERQACALHEQSYDLREGVAAFNAKRRPKFIGR